MVGLGWRKEDLTLQASSLLKGGGSGEEHCQHIPKQFFETTPATAATVATTVEVATATMSKAAAAVATTAIATKTTLIV